MTAAFFDPDITPEETQAAVPEAAPAAKRDRATRKRKPAGLLLAASLQTAAALVWIPQAALLALSVGIISDGGSTIDVVLAALAILALGIIRAAIDAAGGRIAFRTARNELTSRRNLAVAALAARSPLDIGKPASGFAASVVGEQAEAVVPYLARFQPVRMKASAVPLVILACILPVSQGLNRAGFLPGGSTTASSSTAHAGRMGCLHWWGRCRRPVSATELGTVIRAGRTLVFGAPTDALRPADDALDATGSRAGVSVPLVREGRGGRRASI